MKPDKHLNHRVKTRAAPILLVAAVGLILGAGSLMGAHASQHASRATQPTMPETVQIVFDNYRKIQAALAQDSLQGVAESSAAIAEAARNDPGRTFPQRLARQADRLARANNLTAARDAFLRVTPHLIDYVKKNRLAGFYIGHCRMQKLAWLQVDPAIANPYMGKAMPRCARFRELNGA